MRRHRMAALVIAAVVAASSVTISGSARSQNATARTSVQDASVQPIGKVVTAKGAVTIEHVNAVIVQASLGNQPGIAKVGDPVYLGDVVLTGDDGNVGIAFADGTAFNLSSNARIVLNEFVYDPNGKSNSTLFTLAKGTFTFVAGKIAKTGDMKIDTPVATMGIRGTTPHVEISDDGTVKFSTLIETGKNEVLEKFGPVIVDPSDDAASSGSPTEKKPKLNLKICKNC